jgi:hypothetical protein
VVQDPGDLVLYGAEQVVPYRFESDLPLGKLLLRLSLQRRPEAAGQPIEGMLYLVARRGLGPVMAEYLHRVQAAARKSADAGEPALRAAVALCETAAETAFQPGTTFWLFRLEGLPARMRGLCTETPGLELYAPVTDNVAVAVGYRHPIHLDACRASFPADRFYLFSPRGAGLTVVSPAPVLAAIEDVVRIRAPQPRETDRREAAVAGRPDISVPLRLEPSADLRRRAVATLVPWERVDWLRRLCYALPPTALRGYRVALLPQGVLVLATLSLEGFPFGTLLDAAAPEVLVPLGTRVRPAVSPALLADRVGASGGALVVFPGIGQQPVRVPPDAIDPLDRRALSAVEIAAVTPAARPRGAEPGAAAPAVEIENDPLGPMPLWGLDR